jgi:putative hydrolase of the HAD superfamily
VKVIAFDLGRVLFDFDYSLALDKLRQHLSYSKAQIIDLLFYEGFAQDFEKGLISPYQFYLDFNEQFCLADLEYDRFIDAWCDIFAPNEKVVALAGRLSRHYPTFLISNINQAHFEFLYQRFRKTFDLFQDLILSFKVGSIKPEFKIYDNLRSCSGVNFTDIIYIDDRLDLVTAARKFNLNCIQFTGFDALIKELQKFNLKF